MAGNDKAGTANEELFKEPNLKNKLMKKLFLIIIIFMVPRVVCSQEIAPGEQARGYLSAKNILVDHVSGIFNYSIPLFEVRSGGFDLPVKLNYHGGGVQPTDKPGVVGYNWSLQHGGIVTRIIKGEYADEKYGIATFNRKPLLEDIQGVNQKYRDGENDIFTVMFNERSIKFILQYENGKIEIVPLEKTGVKIEFLNETPSSGWVVTDENGVRYLFSVLEWICNYSRQENIGFKSTLDKSYISSWYISRIEIPNSDTIYFEYDKHYLYGENFDQELAGEIEQGVISPTRNYTEYTQATTVTYNYGRAMKEYPFDFEKYRKEYENYISLAQQGQALRYTQDLVNVLNDPIDRVNQFFALREMNKLNRLIMGVMTDVKSVGQVSGKVINRLNGLIDMTTGMTSTYLTWAKECMKRCLSEVNYIGSKTSGLVTAYKIYSPVLRSIRGGSSIIEFHYSGSTPLVLNSVVSLAPTRQPLKTIRLTNRSGFLKSLAWEDKNGDPYLMRTFTYHLEDSTSCCSNRWGDYSLVPGDPNICYASKNSLSSICYSSGETIYINYEYNYCESGYCLPMDIYGGIRLKNLIFEYTGQPADTIRYRYPSPGVSIFWEITDTDEVFYPNLMDRVTYSRFIKRGNSLFEGGNRGLFYPHVEEVFAGKGKNAYLFTVPPYPKYREVDSDPYWLNGLLVAKATYDQSNRLVKLNRNVYYADWSPWWNLHPSLSNQYISEWIQAPPAPYLYADTLGQVRAYSYYTSESDARHRFGNKPKVQIYLDGNQSMSIDPNELFEYNMLPRTEAIPPLQVYKARYGGKVALKKQTEYVFVNGPQTTNSMEHLLQVPNGNRVTSILEYEYDNPEGKVTPSRVIQTLSNGDREVIARYMVSDFIDSAHPAVHVMREKNMLDKILKEQVLLKRAGETRYNLQEEKIYQYEITGEKLEPLLKECWEWHSIEDIPVDSMHSGRLSTLCTFPKDQYVKSLVIDYALAMGKYFPVMLTTTSMQERTVFDLGNGEKILSTTQVPLKSVDAVDKYRYHQYVSQNGVKEINNYKFLLTCQEACRRFVEVNRDIDFSVLPPAAADMYHDEIYQAFLDFSRQVAESKVRVEEINEENFNKWRQGTSYFQNFGVFILDIYSQAEQEAYSRLMFDLLMMMSSSDLTCFRMLNSELDARLLGISLASDLQIELDSAINTCRVYLVVNSDTTRNFSLSCSMLVSGQEYPLASEVFSLQGGVWQVICQEFDVSGQEGSKNVRVALPDDIKVALAVLLPSGCSFEAFSTGLDGLPFCKLNQHGMLEIQEHDGAGRLIRLKDRFSRVLKEKVYNEIIQ